MNDVTVIEPSLPAEPVCLIRYAAQGPFTKKMLRRGAFAGKHFDDDVSMSFVQLDEDPVTRKPVS